MSTTVDERIVSMQFDNKQFEKNVATSMSTLDKLKAKLNLSGAAKGLEEVDKAAKNCNVAVVGESAEKVGIKFNALYSIADQALRNITTSAMNAGKQLISSFTIDPIKTGLSEYETQLNAIQTILANTESKGSTLDDVNKALDELNLYADKTIYNFTEMTKNIGTFTAAGVDLDTSVSAIKGIANLAAVSGSTSQQASTAMYQLSQALASGTVKLMDWNSVVNAGMGGQVFQDALKETARVHGVAIDDIIKKQGSFRESLSEGWLTSEILTDTLAKFTGDLSKEQILQMGYTEAQAEEILKLGQTASDAATKVKTFTQLMETLKESSQSGWAQTWELLIGDFNEAKKIWSIASDELGAIISKSAEDRNKLLSETLVPALNSGWDNFLSAGVMDETGYGKHIIGLARKSNIDIDTLLKQHGSIEEVIRAGGISTEILSQSLADLTGEYEGMTDIQLENLGVTRDEVDALKELNEGIQNGSISMDEFAKKMKRLSGRELIIQSVVNVFKALNSVIEPIKSAFYEIFPPATAEQIYNILDAIHRFTEGLILGAETSDKLKRTFKGLFAVLDIIWYIFKTIGGAVFDVLKEFTGLGGGILSVTATLGDFLVKVRDAIKGSTGLQSFANNVAAAFIIIIKAVKNMGSALKEKIDTSGMSKFIAFLQGAWNVIKTIAGYIFNTLSAILGSAAETITGSGIEGLLSLFNAGMLGGILVGIKKLFDNLDGIIEGFTGIMGSITDTLKAFQQQIKAKVIETISKSMIMLAAAVLILSLIDKDKLERSLAALSIMFVGLMSSLSLTTGIKMFSGSASSILAIAFSLLVIASVLTKLSDLSTTDMISGVLAITGCLAALTGTLHWLSRIKSSRKMATEGAAQLFKIAIALIPIVWVLKQLSNIYWFDLLVSIGGMTAALAALTGTLAVLSTVKATKKMALEGAKQLLTISLALIPLALVVKTLGKMDWPAIAKAGVVIGAGLIAFITALGVVTLLDKASASLSASKPAINIKAVVGKCAQLTLIAAALGILAVSLAIISAISWSGIIKGLTTMVATLVILLKALQVISKMEFNNVGKSIGSMILLGVSMTSLAMSLAVLGQMNWDTIGKGLLAMAGTMAILLTALKVISKVSMSKTGVLANVFSGDMLGLKQESSLIKGAASLLLVAGAIKILASSLLILGQMKLSTIAKGLVAIGGTLAVLGVAAKFLSVSSFAMTQFAKGVALLGVACLAAGAGISLMAVGLSMLGESVGKAIITLCQVIMESADYIAKALVTLLVSVLNGITNSLDAIVSSLLQIILNSISTLAKYIPDIASAFMDLIIGVIDEIINYIPEITKLLTKLVNALFDAIGDVFSQIDTDALLKGAAAIGIIGAMMVALSKIGLKMIPKALLGVVGITAVVVALGTVFGLLAKIPGLSDLIGSGGSVLQAIGSTIGMFIGGLLGGLSTGLVSGGGLENAIAVIKAIADPQVILGLGLIAGLMFAMSKIKTDIASTAKDVAKLGIMIGALSILVTAFAGLGSIGGASDFMQKGVEILQLVCSPEVVTSLGLVAGLLAILAVISKLTSDVGTIVKSVANLGIVFGAIGILVAAMGAIGSIEGSAEFIQKGIEILKALVDPRLIISLGLMSGLMALLGFLGPLSGPAIIGALGLMGVIGVLGACITAFGALAQIPGLTWLINEGGNLLGAIGSAIGKFFGGVLGGIGEGLTSSLPAMATNFSNFMTNLKPFLDGLNSISPEMANSALILSKALLTLTGTNLLTQLTSWFAGGIDMNDLAEQLKGLGQGIANFGKVISDSGVSVATIETGATAAKLLINAINNMPKTGGWWQKIAGEVSISTFSDQFEGLGKGVAAFANAIASTENLGNVKKGANAAVELFKALETMPKTGGLWQKIVGEVDGEAGTKLAKLGTGVKDFANAISGAENLENVDVGAKALLTLTQVLDQMPKAETGWSRWLFGPKEDMDAFLSNVTNLGKGVAAFGEAVFNINAKKVSTGADACLTIIKAINSISTSEGIWAIDVETLKTKLSGLAEAIVKFVSTTNGVTDKDIIGAKSKIEQLNKCLDSFSTSSMDAVIDSFANSKSSIVNAIKTAIQAAIDTIKGFESQFESQGKTIMTKLISGIDSYMKKVENTFTTMMNNALNAIKSSSVYNDFYGAGEYLVEGFVDGMDDNIKDAADKAAAMAKAAKEAAEEALDENSPSKEFYKIGSFAGEGLILALDDYGTKSYKAGYHVAEEATKGLDKATHKLLSFVESDMDTQPTIRPVLDLSDVTSGVNAIDKMFGMTPSIGLMTNVGSVSSMMSKRQNGGNENVVSAIKDLESVIGSSSGDTNVYNINGLGGDVDNEVAKAIEVLTRAIKMGRRS